MGAINGSYGVQDGPDFAGQAGVATGFFAAGQLIAVFEVFDLVLQQDEVDVNQQIFACIIRHVIGDGIVPGFLLGRGKCVGGALFQNWTRNSSGRGVSCGQSRARFVVKEMMEIDPEAAVKFEDRQRSVNGFHLLRMARRAGRRQHDDEAGKKVPTQEGKSHRVVERNGSSTCVSLKRGVPREVTVIVGRIQPAPQPGELFVGDSLKHYAQADMDDAPDGFEYFLGDGLCAREPVDLGDGI